MRPETSLREGMFRMNANARRIHPLLAICIVCSPALFLVPAAVTGCGNGPRSGTYDAARLTELEHVVSDFDARLTTLKDRQTTMEGQIEALQLDVRDLKIRGPSPPIPRPE